jgi:hypothetical protein
MLLLEISVAGIAPCCSSPRKETAMDERKSRKLWIAWMLANTICISALGAGFSFGDCAGGLIGAGLLFAVGLFGGAMLGTAQFAVLRLGHVRQRELWLAATILGWHLGIITLLLALDYGNLSYFPPAPLGTAIWVALMAAVQCWPLVRLTRHVGLWAPVNSVAAALATVAGRIVAKLVDPMVQAGTCGPQNIKNSYPYADILGLTTASLSGAISWAVAGLVFSTITATALIWLLQHPLEDQHPKVGPSIV